MNMVEPKQRIMIEFYDDWAEAYEVSNDNKFTGHLDEVFEDPKSMLNWFKKLIQNKVLEGSF